ncbi:MAG: bifunctional adenosylcobinamide kinase/adenosylcobinamide-phosphate guanylyltransferase [Desulfarculus sp.]|nr:bifunctional adenosylcobinamide kinase/adenosylcobinamide-phosphate guanylyltransferase [Desulfarculus sp.]
MNRHTLVLGGARSGKSDWAQGLAESLAADPGQALIYLATGQARDDEMRTRVARHQARRGPRWTTLEEPLELGPTLSRVADDNAVVLVDCLTMWQSNLFTLAGLDEAGVEERGRELAALLPELPGVVILVGNEVGLGIVPDNALARGFRDQAGLLHQNLAQVCGRVIMVMAGLPLALKGGLPG